MNKEQRLRAAVREFFEIREQGSDESNYVIRVSGDEVELTHGQLLPWDNESGTGNDETWDTWHMNLNTLKTFLKEAQIAIQESEEFEKKHPAQTQATESEGMTKWEYLIHRARLAGITVHDNGGNVLFEQQCDGFVNALIWTYDQTDLAADWLKQADVNLPGWELPWPA